MAATVLVPTGTTVDDLDSVLPWMQRLAELKVSASFVLNRANSRTISYRRARSALVAVASLCPIEIPLMEDIHANADKGLTPLDLDRVKGVEPLTGVWYHAARQAGL
jgi:hypothetical protein